MANPFFGSVTDNLTRLGEKMRVLPELSGEAVVADEIISSINSPMLIMVMGEFSTGKSTFINALVKKDIATVGAQPTTAVITKLSYGTQDKIEVVFRDGTKKIFDSNEFSRLTAEGSKAENDNLHETIDYVSRTLPIDILKNMTIVDATVKIFSAAPASSGSANFFADVQANRLFRQVGIHKVNFLLNVL